jgi:6,7-dimethyl-8-ribityllumazine synthase
VSRLESKASSYGGDKRDAIHEGALRTNGRRFALVAARFNDAVVAKLIEGARAALRDSGAAEEDVELYRCPGAMELAGLARRLRDGGRFDGVVCLGAVIRGGTPHFDLVAGEAARAIGALAAEGRIPVAFGVLACDTNEQAMERAGPTKETNRGYDAAMVVVEMADLYASIEAPVATDLPRQRK